MLVCLSGHRVGWARPVGRVDSSATGPVEWSSPDRSETAPSVTSYDAWIPGGEREAALAPEITPSFSRLLTRRRAILALSAGLSGLLTACATPLTPRSATPVASRVPPRASPTRATAATATAVRSVVSSPSPSATLPTPTPEPRTLTWWTQRSDADWLAAAHAAVDRLTASQPGLTVRVEGGYGDYGKVVGGFAIGRPPEAFEFGELVTYADRDVVRQLDSYLGHGVDPHNYLDPMWANGTWRGKTYGIPALDHGPELGLFWNSALVGGGLPETTRSSLPTLFDAGKAMTKRDPNGDITFLGFDPLGGVGGLLDIARDLVGEDWVDLPSRTIRLATPPYEEYLAAIAGYYNALGTSKVNDFRRGIPPLTTSAKSGLDQGDEGFTLTGYWSVGDVARLAKDPTWTFSSDWAPTVTPGAKVQQVGGRLLGIPTAVKDPDGGWELIRFLASDAASEVFLSKVGTFAASRSFVNSGAWKTRPGLKFWIDSLTQATHLASRSTNVVSGYAEAKWEQAIADVLAGNRSPHDALVAAGTAIQAELQRFDV